MVSRVKNSVEFIYCACGCGFTRPKYSEDHVERRFLKYHYARLSTKGENHPLWKGGRWIDRHGYVFIRINGRRFREHRLVWEEYHKCCLLPTSIVHHLNHNPSDNRIENLEVVPSHSLHLKNHHRVVIPDSRLCSNCYQKTWLKKGHPQWYKHGDEYYCLKCHRRFKYQQAKMRKKHKKKR